MSSKGKNAGKVRVKSFGTRHTAWLETIKFAHVGTQQTFEDYRAEAIHHTTRLARLDRQILEAIATAPDRLREIVLALQALRGVAETTAAIVAIEIGSFARFSKPTKLMSWAGLVPREHSSGGPGKSRRYGITKSGNSHLRRVLTESAWLYRHKPSASYTINKRRQGIAAPVVAIAEKAEQRLHGRHKRMANANKPTNKITTAIARELLGFIWAIAREVEQKTTANTLKQAA